MEIKPDGNHLSNGSQSALPPTEPSTKEGAGARSSATFASTGGCAGAW